MVLSISTGGHNAFTNTTSAVRFHLIEAGLDNHQTSMPEF
jgi:hypothetical protein